MAYYLPTEMTKDLVCYWPLDETASTRYDSVGNVDIDALNMSYISGVRVKNSAKFDGWSSMLYKGGDSVYTRMNDTSFTIGAWVRADSITGVQTVLGRWSVTHGEKSYRLTVEDGRPRFRLYDGSSEWMVGSADFGDIATLTWYYICIFYDITSTKAKMGISVNGVWSIIDGPQNGIDAPSTTTFVIGATPVDGEYFDGAIDQVSIYKRLLTYQEMNWHYNEDLGRTYEEVVALSYAMSNPGTNFGCYWELNETSGTRYDSYLGPSPDWFHLLDINTVGYSTLGKRRSNGAVFIGANNETLRCVDSHGSLTLGGIVDFEFGCWVKPQVDVSGVTCIFSKWSSGAKEYICWIENSRFNFGVHDGSSLYTVVADNFGDIKLNKWYFVCCWSGSVSGSRRIGILVNMVEDWAVGPSGGVYSGSNDFYIGSNNDAGNYFSGIIDEFYGSLGLMFTNEQRMYMYYYGYGRTWASLEGIGVPIPGQYFATGLTAPHLDIMVCDKSLATIGFIDTYISLIWTERYYEAGDFELQLPMEYMDSKLIYLANFLYIRESERLMIIEDIKILKTEEMNDSILITGRSAESLLDRRISIKEINFTGPVELVMHDLVLDNVTDPSNTNRSISLFRTDYRPSLEMTDLYTLEYGRQSVLEMLSSISKSTGIGFRVTIDNYTWGYTTTPLINYIVYKGKDRSTSQLVNPPVIFANSMDNVLTSSMTISTKDKLNVVYVITDDSVPSLQQNFVWDLGSDYSGGADEPSDIDRFETTIDINIDRGTPPLANWEVANIIETKGEERILESTSYAIFDGDFEVNGMFKYGIDFFIGDIVQCILYGQDVKARIIELVRSYTDTGIKTYVTFDFL